MTIFDIILIPIFIVLFIIALNWWQKTLDTSSHNRFKIKKNKREIYDPLFGEGNWKIINYTKTSTVTEMTFGEVSYDIKQQWKVKIIDQNRVKEDHLSEEEMSYFGPMLNRYDIILLAENNPKLCEKMIPYLTFSEEYDKELEVNRQLGDIFK